MEKPLATLWLGSELSYLEQLCLRSALRVGHNVVLFTYNTVRYVPSGVSIANANTVMDKGLIARHRKGSYAPASDVFRYAMLQKFPYVWIDTDLLFIDKMDTAAPYIFAWQSANRINTSALANGVLALPPESALLGCLLHFVSTRPIVAPWWNKWQKWLQLRRFSKGKDRSLYDLEWGLSGPKALTYFVKDLGLEGWALPKDVFYPLCFENAKDLFQAQAKENVESCLTQNTVAIHLWNTVLGDLKQWPPPTNSYIFHQCQRLGLIK